MILKRSLVAAACGWCLTMLPLTAQAGYTALYAFGDSLSDAGNIFLATGGAQPAPPYVAGRFTNGGTAIDDLSVSLGLGTPLPSLAGGNDFAFGGAQTGFAGIPGPASGIPSIAQQVGLFGAAHGGLAPSGALYSVWIGGNDIRHLVADGLIPATLTLSRALTAAQGAAAVEAGAVQALAGAGARHFLVPLVPDVGKTPESAAAGAALAAAASLLAQTYNTALTADVAALAAGLGLDVTFVDIFSFLDQFVANPGGFGFTNATDACYTGPFTGGGAACPTPGQYVFWDAFHPTAAASVEVAALAARDVPEPGTFALLGAAAAAVIAARRRVRQFHSQGSRDCTIGGMC